MRRHFISFILLFFISISGFSQKTSLQGIILNSANNDPAGGIVLQLKDLDLNTVSGSDGSFFFENVTSGAQTLVVTSPEFRALELPVNIVPYLANDIGTIFVTANNQNLLKAGGLLLIEEEAIGEDTEVGEYNVSSLMTSSNDVYISNTTYNFSAMRFKLRGYDNQYSDVYINGVKFNDPERGGFSYGLIGGLNDATRMHDNVSGFNPSSFSYGDIGGVTNIVTNASDFAPGGRTSLAFTNRAYKFRAMATLSTGMMDNGWAVTGSLGYRWADEGNIEGTFYNSLGYFLSVEKKINSKHDLSLTLLGSPTQRAQSSPNLQETMDLLDNNYYNSYWGWQDGKKRNSRIITSYEPATILSYKFQINKSTRLTTSLGHKYTMYGGTALDWSNASDPRPDYYRYLPSYFLTDPTKKDIYTQLWRRNDQSRTQVNWNEVYQANFGKKDGSVYVVEERHNDQQMLNLSSVLNTKLADRITLTAGIDASTTTGMHYKTVNDLLGGGYYLDKDKFVEQVKPGDKDIIQNDLNNPDHHALKGDRFGYDYNIYVNSADVWLQNMHRYNKWDIYYGFKANYTSFYRYGNMKNGRAPKNSYGKGETHEFITQSTKFGLAYKLSGQHIFTGNISYSTLPPLASNSYVSPRIKDTSPKGLSNERVFSADIAYNLSTSIFRGRIAAFQTNFYDQAELISFYYDMEGASTFINYAMSGVNKINRGIEAGLEVKLNSIITLSLAGTMAEYFYANRPEAVISYENGLKPDETETVFLKNYYVGGTPQTAGTFGIHGFYKYWFVDLNLNGFDRIYVDLAPNKRTESAVNAIKETVKDYEDFVKRYNETIHQEKFDGGYTLDLSIGKSIRLKNRHTLNINCQFNNILNNTHLKTGGFEQSRYDYQSGNVDKFPNKYYYAQGFNCFLNVGLRF